MFQIHNSKSPGADSFIAEFFHVYWETVGEQVTKVVERFFNTGLLLKEWNQTLLVMVPKVETPELASYFRPINLFNTIYMCISKCMVNRMKIVLRYLISDYQHAFILGRNIEDNVLLSHELHVINTRNSRTWGS